jgi:hypothetical protein
VLPVLESLGPQALKVIPVLKELLGLQVLKEIQE